MTSMDQDEDDFLYGDHSATPSAPQPALTPSSTAPKNNTSTTQSTPESGEEEEIEEEEEVEVSDDDDDIEIVTESKDGTRPEPPALPERYDRIRTASARPPSAPGAPTRPGAARLSATPSAASSPALHHATTSSIPSGPSAASSAGIGAAHYPAPPSTSKLDLHSIPSFNGETLTKISMDSDLLPAEKPWRKPGADVSDYFNYGFDEFTWTAYCAKQEGLREEFSPQKMMEQMMLMSGMSMGMMPGMEGMDPAAMATMMGGAPGMDMMGPGADPSMFMGGGPIPAGGQPFNVPGGAGQPQDPSFGALGRGQMYVCRIHHIKPVLTKQNNVGHHKDPPRLRWEDMVLMIKTCCKEDNSALEDGVAAQEGDGSNTINV
ncbi:Fip1-domain-containing protein [Ascodesmis nigricans]|uniref:Fip1-domain-containing protein n=1 Tax=Ascodesmis nigricans TaxID=341454 RepID=A0A4S2N6G6_9PEZI|nr:Fip1-domain-containing protein [Ascodesmis nigricans]